LAKLPAGDPVDERHHHESLGLVDLGERRSLDRTGIEHRRGDRASIEISGENLVPVDVSGEDGAESAGDVTQTNHIVGGRECVIRRPDGRALDAVMHAKNQRTVAMLAPTGLAQQLRKAGAHVVTRIGKAGERNALPTHVEDERLGTVEHVNVGMRHEPRVRDSRSLMVARDDQHRHAALGDPAQRLERPIRDLFRRGRSIENVSAVDDDVDLSAQSRLERGVVVREEIIASTAPLYARAHRRIEAEVRISEEEDANFDRHWLIVSVSVFLR